MPYGQLIFWFITYTVIIAGTAISAHAAAGQKDCRFRIILFAEISLLSMVLSVSLIIFVYYQKVLEAESLYYLFLQIVFFMGVTASSLSLLFIPSAVFPFACGKKAARFLAIPILTFFILYAITITLGGGNVKTSRPSPMSLVTGLLQLLLFLSFMAASLYSLVSLLLSWQTKKRYIKAILFSIGIIVIIAVFFIDIIYGLWSKQHYGRELSIFHVLPVYALIVSILLTLSVMKLTRKTSRKGIDPAILKSCGISQREEEVIRLLIDGKGYKGIAEKLCISLATVQTHIRNIYRKTGVNSKVELINLLLGN